jgi:transcriptional regulator with XRE-family HTH domain
MLGMKEDRSRQNSPPFKTLGTHLKYLREQQKQSLAEVSGAVEIETATLERIEHGDERPSEDILMLLISYFNMQDQEAVQLWELAGYDNPASDPFSLADDILQSNKPIMMVLGLDVRTMYTDGVAVDANDSGLTVQFSQSSNGKQANMPVARLGMSYDQAQKVVEELQKALLKAHYLKSPRQLPAGPKINSGQKRNSSNNSSERKK